MDDPLIAALTRAVAAAPDDVALRVHLAELLLDRGDHDGAATVLGTALALDPGSADVRRLLQRALAGQAPPAGPESAAPSAEPHPGADTPAQQASFDWAAAEAELGGPAFDPTLDSAPMGPFQVEDTGLTLADVGGMHEAKARIDAAFFAPMRNEELRRHFGKSLRGGLLLYGPPGCGKTFLARAVAGELGASFLSVGVADILDPYFGVSVQNVHEAFQLARRHAPCVLFLDELDALGQRRSSNRQLPHGVVHQLLTELDGVGTDNEGVFVLGATNQPWDVDPALRRPGRFDRTVLVLPPDRAARAEIFRHHLKDRPVGPIDPDRLADVSDGLSGADIALICEAAVESALLDSARSGTVRPVAMTDLLAAVRSTPASTGPWFETARNVVLFGHDDGTYRDLRGYLKRMKKL